jgi:hypothetical protein
MVAMRSESADPRWSDLQSKAHLPEVQAVIRREISRGMIRVVPTSGGGILIIPMANGSPVDDGFGNR